VSGHDLCLATDCDENLSVAEEKEQKQADIERQAVPDEEGQLIRATLPQDQRVAHAVYYGGGLDCPRPSNGVATDPRKRNQREIRVRLPGQYRLQTKKSFIPFLKPSFSEILPTAAFPFLLRDRLHGFPRLFTVTSEHIRFYFLVFLS